MRASAITAACGLMMGLAGCLAPGGAPCADGTVCAPDEACAPAGGCVDPDRLVACADRADGEACTIDVGDGLCAEGVCVLARCGDGAVGPGEVCDDGNTFSADGCASSCTSDETCGNGVVELLELCDCGDAARPGPASCEGTSNGGDVCRADCVPARCGNGVLDAGEVCDDANLDFADGCTPDCASDETCGNGTVDFFAGELCDDGNVTSRDGCAATCVPEPAEWQRGGARLGRRRVGVAYDVVRARTVAFGGEDVVGMVGETVEFDGGAWRWAATASRQVPTPRLGPAMAYDATRARVVLFGGLAATGRLADTWAYDGAAWTPIATTTAPSPRDAAVMTYDAARDRVVLFGGYAGPLPVDGGELRDTWELVDGTTWVERMPATVPTARDNAGFAFDPSRGVVVMFGGFGPSGAFLEDTWEWNGTTWTDRTTAVRPPQRWNTSMAWDARRGRMVLFGGRAPGDVALDDTWTYVGGTWTQRNPATRPPGREQHGLIFDEARGEVLLIGGSQSAPGGGGTVRDDAWRWNGTTWSRVDRVEPSDRGWVAMAEDAARGEVVLFGGRPVGGAVAETWSFDGERWTLHPAAGPPARDSHAMAYDAARARVVMFGGTSAGAGRLGDTWAWDGATWSSVGSTASPSPRWDTSLAYDRARDRVVLFGGSSDGGIEADTWELDDTGWHLAGPAASPPARSGAAMAYEAARARVVLFGGGDDVEFTSFADTWAYDGATWTELTPPTGPAARVVATLVADPARDRLVLFGGVVTADLYGSLFGDTWEFDGTAWTEVTTARAPTARYAHAAAYRATTGQVELFGGYGPAFGLRGEAWAYGFAAGAPPEACQLGSDLDGDGAEACADADCWAVCSPACPPGLDAAACPAGAPRCGDGSCGGVEDCRSCPADCAVGTAACPVACGDLVCDAAESVATCPGDCAP